MGEHAAFADQTGAMMNVQASPETARPGDALLQAGVRVDMGYSVNRRAAA